MDMVEGQYTRSGEKAAAVETVWNADAENTVLTECRESLAYRITKRSLDLVLSIVGLILLLPFLLVVALIIYVDDPHGSPIFVQDRVGWNGKRFRFYKFRSMVVDAEARLKDLQDRNEMDGPVFKIKEDPRITKFGRYFEKRASTNCHSS